MQYDNMFGNWTVTTEGDCEGRSIINLGTYTGYVDEIAFHLADRAFYGLTFKASTPVKKFTIKRPEVNIKLDVDSGTWNMSSAERIAYFKKLFDAAGRKVQVKDSDYFASVKLKAFNAEKIKQDNIKRQALEKLTPEERAALGLGLEQD